MELYISNMELHISNVLYPGVVHLVGFHFQLLHGNLQPLRQNFPYLFGGFPFFPQPLQQLGEVDLLPDDDGQFLVEPGDVRLLIGQDAVHPQMVDRHDNGDFPAFVDQPPHSPFEPGKICLE